MDDCSRKQGAGRFGISAFPFHLYSFTFSGRYQSFDSESDRWQVSIIRGAMILAVVYTLHILRTYSGRTGTRLGNTVIQLQRLAACSYTCILARNDTRHNMETWCPESLGAFRSAYTSADVGQKQIGFVFMAHTRLAYMKGRVFNAPASLPNQTCVYHPSVVMSCFVIEFEMVL